LEVAHKLPEADVLVNLQGDEPLMPSAILDATVRTLLENQQADMSTAAMPFRDQQELWEAAKVKVVTDFSGKALYFSRAPLAGSKLHLGLYAYRRPALQRFGSAPAAHLEQAERLEQLRALELGLSVYVHLHPDAEAMVGVDTAEDLELARRLLLDHG
jgi:3-deoxy-manno-octulosonate cytidylyltransferase (CMP-KDO synthetase)